jgi:hypothetical protein
MMDRRTFLGFAAQAARPPRQAPRWNRVVAWPDAESPGPWRASFDGKPLRILRERGPESDLLLLLLLDLTGDLALIEPARDALAGAVQLLPPNAWASVLRAHDGNLQVAADPAPSRDDAIRAIRELSVMGRAGLLETIGPAAALGDRLLRRVPVRLAILAVTDSNIYGYREDYANPVINPSDNRDLSRRFPEALVTEKITKLTDRLMEEDAPVFLVHLAYLRDRLNEAYQTGLRQLAEVTGGTAAFCRTPSEIPENIQAAVNRIRTHWALDVELPPNPPRNFTIQLAREGSAVAQRSRFRIRSAKE